LWDRYAGFLTTERNKASKPKKVDLNKWWENHPLKVIVSVVGLTCGVCTYFFSEHLRSAQEHAANELEKAKKELQAKIDDCAFRFSSIERHVRDKSFWDLTALMSNSPPDEKFGAKLRLPRRHSLLSIGP
jgi:hypothetical protein